MEYGSIERSIYIDASPQVVFDVISQPQHLREWWPDDASLDPVTGGVGHLVWKNDEGLDTVVPLTVIEADPPHRFTFRWAYDEGAAPDPTNSFCVTFELAPSGTGTDLRMTETGFRERGWEIAVLEAAYHEHGEGWDFFLPRLAAYAERQVATS